jgi:hypothetical protein
MHSSIELKSIVDVEAEEAYDPEIAASTSTSRPSKILSSISINKHLLILISDSNTLYDGWNGNDATGFHSDGSISHGERPRSFHSFKTLLT